MAVRERGRGEGQKQARIKMVQKFLQSELHCQAYKLYLPEWHLGSHSILQF